MNSLCTYNNGEFTTSVQQFLKVKRLPEAGEDWVQKKRQQLFQVGRYDVYSYLPVTAGDMFHLSPNF